MDGVVLKQFVNPEQFSMLKDAEFVDLVITTDNCSDKIRLYPMKTINEYF